MKWLKGNAGWLASLCAVAMILIGWLSGAFGYVVATEAKPVAKEVVEQEMQFHELKMEPRLQAIEMSGSHNSQEIGKMQKKLDDSMLIQQEILKEVRK
jgi:hypothetical protein